MEAEKNSGQAVGCRPGGKKEASNNLSALAFQK